MAFKKRVYYGEYTLSHWLKMILKKEIVLPDYQRHFVWKEADVREFIHSLLNGEFVPPVIIGNSDDNNLIIDGQQRLTSLLLTRLKLFPNREKFRARQTLRLANENDDVESDEEDILIEWTMREIVNNYPSDGNFTPEEDMYTRMDIDRLDDDFWNSADSIYKCNTIVNLGKNIRKGF